MTTIVGADVPRLEDGPLLIGAGRYVDDLAFPGTLHVAFVRSQHAHALITGVDAAAAKALPGVLAVWTMADIAPHLADRLLREAATNVSLQIITPAARAAAGTTTTGTAASAAAAATFAAGDLARARWSNSSCRGGRSLAAIRRNHHKLCNTSTSINRNRFNNCDGVADIKGLHGGEGGPSCAEERAKK